MWELTERGRGIVERTIPALLSGVGTYRGLVALRVTTEPKRRVEREPNARKRRTFADYYRSSFRQDAAAVIASAPSFHAHEEVALQPRGISSENVVVARWTRERQCLFAAGLFLTVLADQVCYTHFRAAYPVFERLTRYPKWRGDCPGGCRFHIHPANVFRAIGRAPGSRDEQSLPSLPDDVLITMREQVLDFVRANLPEVDADAFWERCDAEIPLQLRLLFVVARRREEA